MIWGQINDIFLVCEKILKDAIIIKTQTHKHVYIDKCTLQSAEFRKWAGGSFLQSNCSS